MGKVIKRILITLIVLSLIGGGAYAGLDYLKKANEKEVLVVRVGSVTDSYYMPSTTLDGSITTNVSQNISFDKDVIIDQIYVNKGDTVKAGDKLISFDMTLVEMELNIARLRKQQKEQDLNKAVNRLNSLENGGPVNETDGSDLNADSLPASFAMPGALTWWIRGQSSVGSLFGLIEGTEVQAAELSDGTGDYYSGDELVIPQEDEYQDWDEPEDLLSSGPEQQPSVIGSEEVPFQIPVTDPSVTPTPEVLDPGKEEPIIYGDAVFYRVLDYNSLPFTGSGSQENPYVFLCSSIDGAVTLKGSFFNRMAGYSEDGESPVSAEGSWFMLEFHEGDVVADPENRHLSCTGYYLIDGSLLAGAVNPLAEMDLTLAEATKYERIETPEGYDYYDGETVQESSGLTRQEAIKIQQMRISSLNLDIQEQDINISKLEKKLSKQEITARIDGVIAYVGDSATGTSTNSSFLRVKSEDGFYVRGTVSELVKDQLTEGTRLKCNSWESGSFDAEIIDVSEYPVPEGSYYGEGNPNVSYYSYTASIVDQERQFSDSEWITVTMEQDSRTDGSLVLSKAFVRSEQGSWYVYKNDNGVLKKQYVEVGGSVNSGYSVLIRRGLKEDDYIAFPYGSLAKDGVRTKEGTLDQLYGY